MLPNEQKHDIWTHHHATVNGVRLHYVEAGAGPLVVLLHGFPEFWYSWRRQIPALAAAGFRVIAPDMRGYNTSDKPRGVRSYRLQRLTSDVVELTRHAGEERAVVVGHDWGGAVAWDLAMRHPEMVEKLVVLNAPHPATWLREMRKPRQLLKASYQFFFQLPRLPEAVIRARNYAAIRNVFRNDPIHKDAFSEEDIQRYVEALDQPGALTATLNYYRAAYQEACRRGRTSSVLNVKRIETPTLLIWGEQDAALTLGLTEGLEEWVPNIRVERIPDASHWVQNDAPGRVNELMLAFLSSSVPQEREPNEVTPDEEPERR